jgi:hypothetical protein
MRAPTEKFSGTYTESQWCAIAQAVRAGVGLDADRTMLPGDQETYTTGSEAAPPAGLALTGIMLRTAIQRIVWFAICRPDPPKQSLADLRRLRDQVDNLRQALLDSQQFGARHDAIAMLAELSQDLAGEIENTPGRRLNARKDARSRMLVELIALWTGTELRGKATGHATETFLRACVGPVIGPTTTKGIEQWLARYRAGDVSFHH